MVGEKLQQLSGYKKNKFFSILSFLESAWGARKEH
jgi:hypothetical protein